MAIEGVVTTQKCADKWCATFWDPVPRHLVALNSENFNLQDFRNLGEVTSSPSGPWTSKLVFDFAQKLGDAGPAAFGENTF